MLESLRIQRRFARLTGAWVALRDLVRATSGAQPLPADEDRFLAVKAEIAREVAHLDMMIPGPLRPEANPQIRRISETMTRFRTLASAAAAPAEEREAFEASWHEGFLFLNRMKGAGLAPPRKDLPTRPRHGAPTGIPRPHLPHAGFVPWLLRFVVQIAFLGLIVYLIVRTVGVRRGTGGQWLFDPPTSFGAVGTNLLEGVRTFLGRAGDLLAPVVAGYGVEVTIFLVGVLLLSAGYWVFIRSH